MAKTTISVLPEDLLREIMCRVPLRVMRTLRLTCKTWDTLSKSSIFSMRNEAARKAGESQMVVIMDYNLYLISVVVDDVEHPSTESKGKLSRLSLDDSDEQHVKIDRVFHCQGLLLCVLKDTFKLVVWNPYLGQTRWIDPPSYSYGRMDGYMYALGYDNNKKIHKILRFALHCEIYDFDSNLWRTLDVGTPNWFILYCKTGVPLNGNTYWIANYRNSNDLEDSLICFDFTREIFGPLLPMPRLPEEYHRVISLLSSLNGEKLSLFLQSAEPRKLEVWVTDPEVNNVLWSKLFTVSVRIPIAYSGYFNTNEEKKVAMFFDKSRDTGHTLNIFGEAGLISQVELAPLVERERSKYLQPAHVCSYHPSLVQVQIKRRDSKRKQLSKA